MSRKRRWLLEVILAVLGIQAFYGGIQLMRDAFAFPVDWLDPLPFTSWGVPGLLLMNNRYADPLTVAFGCGIMAWILVQLFFIPFFFLQPLVFVLGLTLALVAWSRMRDRTEVVDDQPPVG